MFKRFVLTVLPILAVLLLCSCGHGTETPVPPSDPPEDQEEGREFSTPYESGVYYDRLMDVEMTGIYSEDLLRVAFSQEGYHEGDTYDEFLYDWVKKHAVKSACKKGRKTANMVEFKSVRIPFFNEEDEPIEAEDWAKKVRKAFKDETGIKVSKGQGNTLGRVNFIVGE